MQIFWCLISEYIINSKENKMIIDSLTFSFSSNLSPSLPNSAPLSPFQHDFFNVYEQYRWLFFFCRREIYVASLSSAWQPIFMKIHRSFTPLPSVKFSLQIDFSVWKILGFSSTLNHIYPQMHTYIMFTVIYVAKQAEQIGWYFNFLMSFYVDM